MRLIGGPRSLQLQTRRGRDIENQQELEYSDWQRKLKDEEIRSSFPLIVAGATLRRASSGLYNCHGMTFAGRRTAITEERVVNTILEDDGYQQIKRKDVMAGDVVLYYEAEGLSHSGVVVNC